MSGRNEKVIFLAALPLFSCALPHGFLLHNPRGNVAFLASCDRLAFSFAGKTLASSARMGPSRQMELRGELSALNQSKHEDQR